MNNGSCFIGVAPDRAAGLRARVRLSGGVEMPWLGLGVFQMGSDAETARCVETAIRAGYRSIDTASVYGNERGVGAGIRAAGVPREEIFVTTKVWNDDVRAGRVEAAFAESLERLGLDYVDLYLLHWPIRGRIVEAWRAMQELHADGRARAIGVSNFLEGDLEEVFALGGVTPTVNQIEFHPYLQSPELVAFCRARDVQVEAWSPLMQAGAILRNPVLEGIARRLGRTVAQVVLRWNVQGGVVTIPKSVREARMIENSDVFGFELSDDDMAAIGGLDQGRRCGPDPANFAF
ncbi:aldo/keto reductase [Opitutales bacterium ASA1]|nr:aldo/keto reductase [Opitutales bacterium ASA1]